MEWINAEAKKPYENKPVLVFSPVDGLGMAVFTRWDITGKWRWMHKTVTGSKEIPIVTHWMAIDVPDCE